MMRQKAHYEFLADLNDDSELRSVKIVESYVKKFSDIQDQFLQLFLSELTFYQNQAKKETNHPQTNPKDKINAGIIKNMIEILNVQIMLKLVQYTLKQNLLSEQTRKGVSPIDLKVFLKLIPESYKNSIKISKEDTITKIAKCLSPTINGASLLGKRSSQQ